MRLEKRQPSGREKDEASIELLEKLREELYSSNISTVRQSAFHLSWMQEDGLDILREALLGDTPRRAKSAAAYGLRKMRGRMKKKAEETLIEGTTSPDRADRGDLSQCPGGDQERQNRSQTTAPPCRQTPRQVRDPGRPRKGTSQETTAARQAARRPAAFPQPTLSQALRPHNVRQPVPSIADTWHRDIPWIRAGACIRYNVPGTGLIDSMS